MNNINDVIKGLYNCKTNDNKNYIRCTKNVTTGQFIPFYDINEYNIELFERKLEFNDILECINISEILTNNNTLEYLKNIHNYISSYDYLFINQILLSEMMNKGEFPLEILYHSCIRNNKGSIKTYLLPKDHYAAYLIKVNNNNELQKYIKIG